MNNPLQFFRVQISDKFINSNTNKLHSCFYSRNMHMAGEYIIYQGEFMTIYKDNDSQLSPIYHRIAAITIFLNDLKLLINRHHLLSTILPSRPDLREALGCSGFCNTPVMPSLLTNSYTSAEGCTPSIFQYTGETMSTPSVFHHLRPVPSLLKGSSSYKPPLGPQ